MSWNRVPTGVWKPVVTSPGPDRTPKKKSDCPRPRRRMVSWRASRWSMPSGMPWITWTASPAMIVGA